MSDKVTSYDKLDGKDCGGTNINTWAFGGSANYGQGFSNNVAGCKEECAKHSECAGFTMQSNKCSYWKKGPLSPTAASGKTCFQKSASAGKLLPGRSQTQAP